MVNDIYGSILAHSNCYLSLDSDLTDNKYTYSGTIIFDKLGYNNPVYGDILYFDFTNQYWNLASCESFDTMLARAVYVGQDQYHPAKNILLLYGIVKFDNLDFSNRYLYVGKNGKISDSAPLESNYITQQIGIIERQNHIFFNFNTTWLVNI